jgi:hypothetical protein
LEGIEDLLVALGFRLHDCREWGAGRHPSAVA